VYNEENIQALLQVIISSESGSGYGSGILITKTEEKKYGTAEKFSLFFDQKLLIPRLS
jgi:hypothetical protein